LSKTKTKQYKKFPPEYPNLDHTVAKKYAIICIPRVHDLSFPSKFLVFSLLTILEAKPERKRPLGRQRHRWEDNVKINNIII
jgi:hypothetical protein